MKSLSLVFAAGCFGGLINSLALWIGGRLGLTAALGVKLAPALTPAWLYPRLVWGGVWGVLLLLPLLKNSLFWRGLILSLGPSAVLLLYVFPVREHQGLFGLALGQLTPLVVIFLNACWGWAGAAWLKAAGR